MCTGCLVPPPSLGKATRATPNRAEHEYWWVSHWPVSPKFINCARFPTSVMYEFAAECLLEMLSVWIGRANSKGSRAAPPTAGGVWLCGPSSCSIYARRCELKWGARRGAWCKVWTTMPSKPKTNHNHRPIMTRWTSPRVGPGVWVFAPPNGACVVRGSPRNPSWPVGVLFVELRCGLCQVCCRRPSVVPLVEVVFVTSVSLRFRAFSSPFLVCLFSFFCSFFAFFFFSLRCSSAIAP